MESVEPRTHRATLEAWLGQLLLPAAFLVVVTLTLTRLSGLHPLVGGLALLGLAAFTAVDCLLPMLRDWLLVDGRGIEGAVGGGYIHLYWTEVIAAWMHQRRRRAFLCLGTRERTVVIPMRFFDAAAIWKSVRQSVAPSALTEDALTRLPDFQDWRGTQGPSTPILTGLEEIPAPRSAAASGAELAVADHWIIQVAAWAGLTCFILAAADALASGLPARAAGFAAPALASAALLANWGMTEFTASAVVRFTLLGAWRIRWDSVRRVEVGLFGAVLVLVGEDSQLVIPGAKLWTGAGKHGARAMLMAQVKLRGIPLQRSPWATFKVSRGARIQK